MKLPCREISFRLQGAEQLGRVIQDQVRLTGGRAVCCCWKGCAVCYPASYGSHGPTRTCRGQRGTTQAGGGRSTGRGRQSCKLPRGKMGPGVAGMGNWAREGINGRSRGRAKRLAQLGHLITTPWTARHLRVCHLTIDSLDARWVDSFGEGNTKTPPARSLPEGRPACRGVQQPCWVASVTKSRDTTG